MGSILYSLVVNKKLKHAGERQIAFQNVIPEFRIEQEKA